MAITNQERVGKAMELLRVGLAPFVEREFKSLHQAQAADVARRYLGDDRTVAKKQLADWDVAALLKLMWETWNEVFGKTLGRAERSLVQERRDFRNKWAHQEPFSSDDADRALDSMTRLLTAVSAPRLAVHDPLQGRVRDQPTVPVMLAFDLDRREAWRQRAARHDVLGPDRVRGRVEIDDLGLDRSAQPSKERPLPQWNHKTGHAKLRRKFEGVLAKIAAAV